MPETYSAAWNYYHAAQVARERPRWLVELGRISEPMLLQKLVDGLAWVTLWPPSVRPSPNDYPYLFVSRAEADQYLAATHQTGTFRLIGRYYHGAVYAQFSR